MFLLWPRSFVHIEDSVTTKAESVLATLLQAAIFSIHHVMVFFLAVMAMLSYTAAYGSQLPKISLTMEEKGWLAKNINHIELWYNNAFSPIEFSDENNQFSGITADIFALVENRLGITVPKKKIKDRSTYSAALRNGQCAIAPGIVNMPESQKILLFSSVYLNIPIVIIGPVSMGTDTSLEDLSGKKIAVVAGSTTENFIKKHPEKKLNLIPVQSVEDGLRMTAFGQVDAYVGCLAVVSHYISRQEITSLKLAGTTDLSHELRIGVNKKYPLLFSSIQKALDSISQKEFDAVKNRWITLHTSSGKSPGTLRLLMFGIVFLCGAILILIAISTIVKHRLYKKTTRLENVIQDFPEDESRFWSLFENAPVPFGELDINTGAFRFNRCFTDVFGYTNDEVPNLDAWWPLAYPDPEYCSQVQGEWEQAVREKRPIGVSQETKEFKIACKTGEVKQIAIRANVLTDKVLVTFMDISELRHSETKIKKNLELFQTLFDLLPFSCVINDMEGRYLMANKYFCKTAQMPLEKIAGRTMEEVGINIDKIDKEKIKSEIKKHGFIKDVEMVVENNGTRTYILFSSSIIDWKDGKAILSATVDITERKKVEKALKKSQERLTLAFDAANDGLWDFNLASEQVYCSPNYYKMLGYKQGDFLDTLDTWKQLVHPDDQEPSKSRFYDYISGKTKVYESEFRMQTKQGGWKWILSRGRIVEKDETGSPLRFVGTHIDRTEKKLAEMALQESEENFRVTLDSIGDAVIATDINGNVTRMNPVAAQLTGWTTNEAAGRPLEDVFHIVNAVTNDRVTSPVQKVLTTGKVVDLANHTVLLARDGTRYQVADSGSPIRNDTKKIIGVVLVFRDVTGTYEMQERLRQSMKMEAIGLLAGGIAHDFNNILSAVMGFTDLAKLEAGDQEPLKKYLDSVSTASLRARDLVQHILTFSRKSEVKKQIIYIDPIIKETLKFIRASLPASIDIRQEFNVHKARVLGDPTQIHQILMNLFTNAGHAMKNSGGRLEVVLDTVYVSQADTRHFRNINPGQYYQLTVSDTGTGIPKVIIDRIFEPFFTTKKREEGTGMGLSTVYGILKTMGGGISVYSEAEVGTTFKVLIPEKKADVLPEKIGELPLVKGKGKILVVDDEAPIVTGTEKLLSKLGYTVTGTTSSREALDRIRSAPRYFDLVLTDMTMPGMNGLELSRSIRSVNEDIPIVLCTGFSEGLTGEICASTGIFDLVMKPLIAAELSMTVHEAINSIPGKEET